MGRVLVVEDDAVIRMSLERMLAKLCPHCTIAVAASGQEALDLMEKEPADLIISDHSMPGISGLEMLGQSAQKWPEAKRFLITAYPLSELDQGEVASAELHGFLAKPFQILDIKALIDENL